MSISDVLTDDVIIILIKSFDPYTRTQMALTCKILLRIVGNDESWIRDWHDIPSKHILYDGMKLWWCEDSDKVIWHYIDKDKNHLNYDGSHYLFYVVASENRNRRLNKIPYNDEQKEKFLRNCDVVTYELFNPTDVNNMHRYVIMRALINIYYCFGVKTMKDNWRINLLNHQTDLMNKKIICFNGDDSNDKDKTFHIHTKAEKIHYLPWGLKYAVNLTELIMIGQKIRVYPKELCYLPNLSYINLYKNELISLPQEFSNLTSLERLNIGGNKFIHIPDVLGNMPNLIFFDFNNCFKTIAIHPPDVAHLRHLKRINFTGTNLWTMERDDIIQLGNRKLEELYLNSGDEKSVSMYEIYRYLKEHNQDQTNHLRVILC